MTEREIMGLAISLYGASNQERIAIEECCELCVEINHKQRGRDHHIAEEIADVEIMLEQLKIINNCADVVDNIKKVKIARLKRRLLQEVCVENENEENAVLDM